MYGNWLFFLTPDNYFVSLDAATGKERWHHEIANVKREYFSTSAPIIIGKQVIIGVGGDSLDVPGYLESRDPESGDVVWRWYTTPRPGQPGAESWPNAEAMTNGGGMPWLPGTYDPELNLYYIGTGNPQPVLSGKSREGDNLWTCSIVALNPDTGKARVVVLPGVAARHARLGRRADAGAHRRRHRRQAAQARRAGQPQRPLLRARSHQRQAHPDDDAHRFGELDEGPQREGPADSESRRRKRRFPACWCRRTPTAPPTGRRRASIPTPGCSTSAPSQSFSVFYLTDTDEHPQGWAAAERGVGNLGRALKAIDYKTGKVKWSRPLAMTAGGGGGGPMGLLSTAGKLLFGNDGGGNFVAYDPRPASRSGTSVSARTPATVRKPTCSTAASSSSSAPATRCTRLRCRGSHDHDDANSAS